MVNTLLWAAVALAVLVGIAVLALMVASRRAKDVQAPYITRKIGERFVHGGKMYRVVEGYSCLDCAMYDRESMRCGMSDKARGVFGDCHIELRKDKQSAIFKTDD